MFLNIKILSIGVCILARAVPASSWSYVPPSWVASLPHNQYVHTLKNDNLDRDSWRFTILIHFTHTSASLHEAPFMNWIPSSAPDIGGKSTNQIMADYVTGGAINKFHPYLRVDQGCVPYPSVKDEGSGWIGEGLNPTGAINGGCSQSAGQVYARTYWINGRFGIYYAWYFPKDQIAWGPAGHRHDWEGVVVWATGSGNDASLVAVCPARHGTNEDGKYHCDRSNFYRIGERPRMVYRPDGGSTHALFTGQTETTGYGDHPLAYWDWMPQLCRDLLHWGDYGSAIVPIKMDGQNNFIDNMWRSARRAGIA